MTKFGHWGTALAWSWLVLGCGPQYADPITRGSDADPCLAWTTIEECLADTVHGCKPQPNVNGCLTTDATCAAQTCQGGDPFVRVSGQTLRLHDEPFRFVGVNSWGIAWDPEGCKLGEFVDQDEALVRMFDDLVAMRVKVARIWAFQTYAGSNGADYSRFDNVVRYARRANVRLIFVLENGRKDNCSRGNERDDYWFTSGHLSPYDTNPLSYQNYVRGIVTHYKNEPTILAWELMHEASTASFVALDGFVRTMSELVRKEDSNHLIAIGVNCGPDGTATSRTDGPPSSFFKLHAYPTVDLVDIHEFGYPDIAYPENNRACRDIAESLDKPIFFGALAVATADASPAALKLRASQIKAKIDAAFAHGFVGTLAYDYYPDWSATEATTFFDSRPGDPLGGPNGVLANASATHGLP